jgi:hypothetical protein
MARHVVGLEPHATAVTPQVLAIAEPWIVAGLGTALWAYAPQLMRLFRSLNPRDTLAGTTLTKEQLAAFADGLRTMPIGHAPGTIERSHQEPLETGDVLHPNDEFATRLVDTAPLQAVVVATSVAVLAADAALAAPLHVQSRAIPIRVNIDRRRPKIRGKSGPLTWDGAQRTKFRMAGMELVARSARQQLAVGQPRCRRRRHR